MQRVLEWEANRKQTAAFFGIAVQSLDAWVNRGCPCEKQAKFLMFYLPEVVQWRYQNDNKAKLDLTAERARLAKEQADKTAMENARIKGLSVDVERAGLMVDKVFMAFRSRVLAIPARAAPHIHGCESIAKTRDEIEAALYEALNELADINIADIAAAGISIEDEATAEADDKPVGRPRKKAKSRGKRRARAVANR